MSSLLQRIELRHLRYFVAVAECGSLRRAAERLNISQPPLGRQIQQLETELGIRLFDRGSRGLTITEAGRELLDRSRDLMTNLEYAFEQVDEVAKGLGGSVVIEYTDDFLYGLLPRALGRFINANPTVNLSLELAYGATIAENVLAGKTDVGFLAAPLPAHARGLVMRSFYPLPLVVAVPADHRLADREAVHLFELADETFLCSEIQPTNGFYVQVVSLLRSTLTAPRIRSAMWPSVLMLNLAAQGTAAGVVLLCRDAAPPSPPGVRILNLLDAGASVKRCMIWREGSVRNSVARLLAFTNAELQTMLEPEGARRATG